MSRSQGVPKILAENYRAPAGGNVAGLRTLAAFETFASVLAGAIITRTTLFAQSAIRITFDDSGYTQPLDYFGAWTRASRLVPSPWARLRRQ